MRIYYARCTFVDPGAAEVVLSSRHRRDQQEQQEQELQYAQSAAYPSGKVPLFLYLAMNKRHRAESAGDGASNAMSLVATTDNLTESMKQNNGLLPRGPKTTRHAESTWRTVMVIGPYERYAPELRTIWSGKSRGVLNRIKAGLRLAATTEKQVYLDP